MDVIVPWKRRFPWIRGPIFDDLVIGANPRRKCGGGGGGWGRGVVHASGLPSRALHLWCSDQMLDSAASDLGLHCLLVTCLGVSRVKWVKIFFVLFFFQHIGLVIQNLSRYEGNV